MDANVFFFYIPGLWRTFGRKRRADFKIQNYGSISLVEPLSIEAREHLEQNAGSEARWLESSLVVEHRFVSEIVSSLRESNWKVE